MGWNGAGGYTRQRNFSADASAGIKILASAMDQELDDMASAFTNVRALDGQNAPTADLPMGAQKHVNVAAAASVTDYFRTREYITQIPIFVKGTGDSTAVLSVSTDFYATASATQAPPDGSRLIVTPTSTDFDSSTVLRLNTPRGVYSAPVHTPWGQPVHGKQIRQGTISELIFHSASASWQLLNPYRGAQALSGIMRGRNAAGTVTGVAPASVNCFVNVDGDFTTLNIAGLCSVSVSVSTHIMVFSASGLAALRAGTNDQGDVQAILVKVSGGAHIACTATFRTSGSVEFSAEDGSIFSADQGFKVPPISMIFVARR